LDEVAVTLLEAKEPISSSNTITKGEGFGTSADQLQASNDATGSTAPAANAIDYPGSRGKHR
jgi:hypothetical protein